MRLYQSDTAVAWFATQLVTQATRAAGVLRSKTRNRGRGPILGGGMREVELSQEIRDF